MGLRAFYWAVICRAFSGKFWQAEKISGAVALFFAVVAKSFGGGAAMLWVPVAVFAAVFVATVIVGLLVAPYQIYGEERRRREEAEDRLAALIHERSDFGSSLAAA